MKRKNIDTMREVRLWIGQIVVPAITVVGSALAIPEVRSAVAAKANDWRSNPLNKKLNERRMRLNNGPLIFSK